MSDVLLFLPEEGIVYLGDLLFIGFQPMFALGDPEELLRILDRVEDLDPKLLVPGHGPVGTVGDIQITRDYVSNIEKIAEVTRASKMPEQRALAIPIPKPFDTLKWRAFWKENLEFLIKREPNPA